MDILKLKIVSLGLKLEMFDDSSLQYLVDHNPANIRSMEGDLKRFSSYLQHIKTQENRFEFL